jgi:UDP-glucose 4-epimerase
MKILLTGASSFTGYWFACALSAAGHEVCCAVRGEVAQQDGVRGERVRRLADAVRCEHGVVFGSAGFMRLVDEGGWDVLCHHAAEASDYGSPAFDWHAALAANTHELPEVLDRLVKAGCGRVVLTGSVFERGEGTGVWSGVEPASRDSRAVSAYGLSKTLTAEVFRYHAALRGLALGKFVIPNPFGPLEDLRFTAYLLRQWFAGDVAEVRTPEYVRDNIHVSLLARAYAGFVTALSPEAGFVRLSPSGYSERQGEFAERFARELRPRLELPCKLAHAEQTRFDEPRVRINTDPLDHAALAWSEPAAWDEVAEYAREMQRQAD